MSFFSSRRFVFNIATKCVFVLATISLISTCSNAKKDTFEGNISSTSFNVSGTSKWMPLFKCNGKEYLLIMDNCQFNPPSLKGKSIEMESTQNNIQYSKSKYRIIGDLIDNAESKSDRPKISVRIMEEIE